MHATSRLAGLPELTGVEKVWFSGWYDGPLTGIAVHGGDEYWFAMVGTSELQPRIYVLHRLSGEEIASAWEMHREFAALGVPGCLHRPPCPRAGSPSAEALAALRDRWPEEHEDDYLNVPAIGWFRDL